ncbi:MAG: hypothetical protein H7144_00055 [Burkholderiales bacterium]|nr:hypothetical protein [Phycisphaerae bacterium]
MTHEDDIAIQSSNKKCPPKLEVKLKPGDLLHWLIAMIGYLPSSDCNCEQFQAKMNHWGWMRCWLHRSEIVDHLVSEAAKNGVNVNNDTVLGLLKAAFIQARATKRKGAGK